MRSVSTVPRTDKIGLERYKPSYPGVLGEFAGARLLSVVIVHAQVDSQEAEQHKTGCEQDELQPPSKWLTVSAVFAALAVRKMARCRHLCEYYTPV